ncbi:hypothetical protein PsYK624_125620 [Phanerochaete sordida]|uniref:Uncharacterized protein n=1 Tax=Phanerochaete sordida TaxID=48140 RepID=A0A9P3GIV3_9APHY|nr:hypothetical protein PsYK624_125620 [Phanerochaete sordida]
MADAAAYVSAAAEHRRKKSAMDKARANYLCSQLRLRLQYAKLKVDHGWQRQNLNEVENLYFRHSQRRRLVEASSLYSASSSSLGSTPTLPYPTSARPQDSESAVSTQHPSDLPISGAGTQPNKHSNATAVPDSSQVSPSPRGSASPDDSSTPPAGDVRAGLDSARKSTDQGSPEPPQDASADGSAPPMGALSPAKAASPYYPSAYYDSAAYAPHPYAHYPARVLQYTPTPPGYAAYSSSTYSASGYSPQQYLSKAYVSSSPFPLNAPASPSLSATAFGGTSQALTYDSFWSTHASWNVHPPPHGHAPPPPPLAAVASGVPVPVSPVGGGPQNAS